MSTIQASEYWINAAARISGNKAYRNNEQVFAREESTADEFLTGLYKHLAPDYPKWYKMDRLSKLGILAAELVLGIPDPGSNGEAAYTKAIVLANRHASLDTDRRFVDQLKEIPSPAVFVYTLPNIVTGEISIRHGYKGEQAFFVDEECPVEMLVNYVWALLEEGGTESCLLGWTDILGEQYNATLYRVSRVREDSVFSMSFTSKNVYQYLYHEQGSVS